MENRFGCCGLNCEECPVFVATTDNDYNLRQTSAKEWSVLYADYLGKALEPSDINCKGCHSEYTSFIGCINCPIKQCCSEKSLGTC
ncbi:DUF3795 domain-containing protein, partial [Candidatus Bathyarchaeota archaeon]|nr:DUF3795 domain-containing protein [Candidatus Bathyarchaeota archaeon]